MSKGNKLDMVMESKLSLGEGQSVLACLRLRTGRHVHGTLLCTRRVRYRTVWAALLSLPTDSTHFWVPVWICRHRYIEQWIGVGVLFEFSFFKKGE